MEGYQLNLETFKGPLDKLLELIEARELEVTRLNLADVTGNFIAYVNELEEVQHKHLADFVAVAARLILIKSHALLPHLQLSQEEEQDIADLERRLKFYKEFKEGEGHIQELWGQFVLYSRPFLLQAPSEFYLSQKLKPSELKNILEELSLGIDDLERLEEDEVEMVSMEEKIKEMLVRVKDIVKTSFSSLSKDKEKSEVVVMFLALLHLLRDSQIEVEQEEIFAEINIVNTNE